MMETHNPAQEGRRSSAAARTKRSRRKMRRAASGLLALALALTGAGILADAVTPDAQTAQAQPEESALIQQGKELYDVACVTCHGANLQGVKGRGKSLIGVGEGAVYFQVHSGRMPMLSNSAQAPRKTPRYNEEQILALSAYVQSHGGGAGLVRDKDGSIAMESLRGKNAGPNGEIDPADVARGGELFRLNCASCHNFTGRGGALSSGKYAPVLDPANEQEIYQAMLTGPQNMPKFSDRQLTADEKKDIIAYIKSAKETPPQGGYGLGGIGPVTEGMLMWLVGIVALVAAALWIGSRQ
ncbi:cytochrome c [Corynebacterium sp. TAE3-ERU12]|uniref:cytochrome bc1 complex diheme cytochrome c subunit n=1 Tax=Corynebacterium sp. TAE3-ERU12 TaxID=2849491 RepID=UPI001C47F3AA|nr:cytochrome c [Corynebacterium sp. TAE3-ERU12]MBV7296254.1 cytochrome c [Corynebacterium sp. TAE3-ERU12]